MEEQVLEAARVIWSWLPINETPKLADMIFVLGNSSNELPYVAANLYKQKLAPLVVISGGRGRISKNDTETEAARYSKVLLAEGVPGDKLLSEDRASNTGENIEFAKRLLEGKNISAATAIAVTTPVLSRRHKATLLKLWPEVDWVVSTPSAPTVDERMAQDKPEHFIEMIVGEVDRLQSYPSKGFMGAIEIPKDVIAAKDALVKSGFTEQVVSG